ncbi:cytochrome P450 [Bipolaris maydis]|nr:cytochrome P450 [Bipolaris maydis]KAJ6210722.1 cytochrome P450 [Bipolaris maydis]
MKSLSLFLFLFLFCLSGVWCFRIAVKLLSPLGQITGPFLAKYTRLWLLMEAHFGLIQRQALSSIGNMVRSVVRIAPNEYSIDDLVAAKAICCTGHGRKVTAIYPMTNLVQLEQFVDECTSILEKRLNEFASSGTSIDISHWLQCYAFDVLGKMTFGRRFGFLDSGEVIQGIMSSLSEYLVYCANSKNLSGLLHAGRFAKTQLEEKYKKAQAGSQNSNGTNTSEDFITKPFRIQAQNPTKMTNEGIISVCNMKIEAGSDTASISLTSIIFNLLKFPRSLLSCPITSVVLAGQYFPPGVAYANTKVFGQDAHEFRPERWLEQLEGVGERESYFRTVIDHFEQGSRTCLGKNICLMELSRVIPQIIRHFYFLSVTTSGEPKCITENFWFVRIKGFHCRAYKRNAK